MGNLTIKPTKNTPYVNLDETKGVLVIEGKSYPGDSIIFFQPIFEWIEKYESKKTVIKIKLEYFNTSTCKQLLSLIRAVFDNNSENEVKVKWYYEENDLDVLEIGQHMESILKTNFEFKPFVEDISLSTG